MTLALMEPSPRLFRGMILASIAISTMGVLVQLAFPGLIPEAIHTADQQALDNIPPQRLFLGLGWIVIYFIAGVVGIIGLYLFKSWARPLNVFLVLGLVTVWPIFGYNLSSGWSQAFFDIAAITWGAVLGMAYFSVVRERFTS